MSMTLGIHARAHIIYAKNDSFTRQKHRQNIYTLPQLMLGFICISKNTKYNDFDIRFCRSMHIEYCYRWHWLKFTSPFETISIELKIISQEILNLGVAHLMPSQRCDWCWHLLCWCQRCFFFAVCFDVNAYIDSSLVPVYASCLDNTIFWCEQKKKKRKGARHFQEDWQR